MEDIPLARACEEGFAGVREGGLDVPVTGLGEDAPKDSWGFAYAYRSQGEAVAFQGVALASGYELILRSSPNGGESGISFQDKWQSGGPF